VWGSAGFWDFWLANPRYESSPKKLKNQGQEGTKAPIDPSFQSGFVGKKVEDVAEWLKNKPDYVDLEEYHFAILDRGAEEDKTVVACRIGDAELKGDKLDRVRFPAKMSALHLGGMEYGTREECMGDGHPLEIKY
jgi:hypothetical protein